MPGLRPRPTERIGHCGVSPRPPPNEKGGLPRKEEDFWLITVPSAAAVYASCGLVAHRAARKTLVPAALPALPVGLATHRVPSKGSVFPTSFLPSRLSPGPAIIHLPPHTPELNSPSDQRQSRAGKHPQDPTAVSLQLFPVVAESPLQPPLVSTAAPANGSPSGCEPHTYALYLAVAVTSVGLSKLYASTGTRHDQGMSGRPRRDRNRR